MSLAIIAPITVSKHPNADRLQLGNVLGNQVVTGLDVQTGDLGIFFPEGLQLSEEYAQANDLVRRKAADGSHAGGFFEENRRVRCQKFRKQKSEGYWAPLATLSFAGKFDLKVGDRIDSINGIAICTKYYTRATRAARAKNRTKVNRRETIMFHAHFDTDQLRFNLDKLKRGSLVTITLKMHGTSQRTGYVQDEVPSWWRKLLRLPLKTKWSYLTGTRNVIVKPTGFREAAANLFATKLHKGETVFYEIVGYEGENTPVMKPHSVESVKDAAFKKELLKIYEPQVTYTYGCPNGESRVYVYRVTMTNEDGFSIDLPWHNVKARCAELGVDHVPELATHYLQCTYDETIEEYVEDFLNGLNTRYLERPDPIGLVHPTEGVCVRIEGNGETKARIYKHKSFTFGVLEGYIKDKDDYVDTEEAA